MILKNGLTTTILYDTTSTSTLLAKGLTHLHLIQQMILYIVLKYMNLETIFYFSIHLNIY